MQDNEWISFRALGSDIELQVDGTSSIVSLATFENLIRQYTNTLRSRQEPILPDEPLPETEGAPLDHPQEPHPVAPDTVVDPQRPWVIDRNSVAAVEILFRPTTRVPNDAERQKWNSLLRSAARGNQQAISAFDREINRGIRGDGYQFRLYGVLQWLQQHPEIDPDALLLPGESPNQKRDAVSERFAVAAADDVLGNKKQHPWSGLLGLNDPVVRGELERQKPQTVEPGPFSFESMYPSAERTEPRTFTDDFRGNKLRDAQHAPEPEKPFAPEPGRKGNE